MLHGRAAGSHSGQLIECFASCGGMTNVFFNVLNTLVLNISCYGIQNNLSCSKFNTTCTVLRACVCKPGELHQPAVKRCVSFMPF